MRFKAAKGLVVGYDRRLVDALAQLLAGAEVNGETLADIHFLAVLGIPRFAGFALAAIAGGYRRIRGRDGLGFGDAKLLAGAGAWAGMEALSQILLIACAAALALIAFKAVRGERIHRHSRLAFGPCIAIGLWIVWLYGPLALADRTYAAAPICPGAASISTCES